MVTEEGAIVGVFDFGREERKKVFLCSWRRKPERDTRGGFKKMEAGVRRRRKEGKGKGRSLLQYCTASIYVYS